jgi:hypothetical protein
MNGDCAGDPRENYDYDYAPERAKLAALESVKLDPGVECDTSEGIAVFRLTPETEQLVAEATSLRNELTEVAAALGLDAADWRDLARGVRELAAEHRALTYVSDGRRRIEVGPGVIRDRDARRGVTIYRLTPEYERLVEIGRSGGGPVRPAPAEPEFDVGPGVRAESDGMRHTACLTPEAPALGGGTGIHSAPKNPTSRSTHPLMRCVIPEITPADLRPTTVTLEAATINAAEPSGYRSPADAHLTPPGVSDGR